MKCFAVLALSVIMKLNSRIMTYIGEISLFIYLLHGMVIDVLKKYMSDGWLILACITISIFFAMCFRFITEKIILVIRKIGRESKGAQKFVDKKDFKEDK